MKLLQDARESKQWSISIRGKDHKVRDQLEKLVKLLTLCDGVVKQALTAQPYAALAWSAVSIFLPVSLALSTSFQPFFIHPFTLFTKLLPYDIHTHTNDVIAP